MRFPILLLCSSAVCPEAAALQAPTYDVVPLTGLPGPYRAEALNDAGEVAGSLHGTPGAFVWQAGVVKTLLFPGQAVEVGGINGDGVVVGKVSTPFAADGQVLLWDSRLGGFELVSAPVGVTPFDLNADRTVVGIDGYDLFGFVFDPDTGQFDPLAFGPIPDTPIGTLGARGINDLGVVVGSEEVFLPAQGIFQQTPYRWTGTGGLEALPTLVGGHGGRAVDVDADGDILGVLRTESFDEEPALWKAGTSAPATLGAPAGYFVTQGVALNVHDDVAVFAYHQITSQTRGFLWRAGQYHDLSAAQPASESLFVIRPVDLNASGTLLVERSNGAGLFSFGYVLLVERVPAPVAVLPEVADPGDSIRVVGEHLAAIDHLEFVAEVGGPTGQTSVTVPPSAVSDVEVTAVVPQINAFAGPDAVPPSAVQGSVLLWSAGKVVGELPFGFLEATFDDVTTAGSGGSAPAGHTPRSGYQVQLGDPRSGNPSFTPMLSCAPPGDLSLLAVGLPAASPFPPFFGGSLYLDPAGPLVLLAGPLTQTFGVATVNLPIPPVAPGLAVGLQWFTVDPLSLATSASDLLRANL
jgi:hypothetical protein